MQSFFDTHHLNLRPVEPEDIDTLYQWENNTTLWEVGQSSIPFSRYVLKQYVETINDDIFAAQQLRLIIEEKSSKEVLGAVDLYDFDPLHRRAGIGILIFSNKYQRRGYATEALEAIEKYAFHFLGLHQIYATVTDDNSASIKLFERLDFEHTSTKKDWIRRGGKWMDQLLFQKITPFQQRKFE
ncbi:GNAT family N-acetyltransferase [Halosquirtibacter xylanolyticus]|uniref:GNAT family N-acetyltransferase n=1 Tax=Halosquirtibacter xylanolyticus TaxID=3374599 RepID=UPI0037481A88|nr:GNAT family N-acetyltransferase [Prolixibacteraceae bacterium]